MACGRPAWARDEPSQPLEWTAMFVGVAHTEHPEARELVPSAHCLLRFRERMPVRTPGGAVPTDLLLEALDAGEAGWRWEEQPEDGLTYAEKIGPQDRTLDPATPAAVQDRLVRALSPHIGARLALADGSFLGVRRARPAPDGTLELLEVQPQGGRAMPYADYVRGRGA